MAVSQRTKAIEQCATNIVSVLKFVHQTSNEVREGIMYLLDAMCDPSAEETERQLKKFQSRLFSKYNEWPGPMEFRGVFCSLFRPADGIEADAVATTMQAEAEKAAIEQSELYKQVGAGESAALLRELLPGKMPALIEGPKEKQSDPVWTAQNQLWFQLCKEYPVPRVFKRLTLEFAAATNERRKEILEEIDTKLTKAGCIGQSIANQGYMTGDTGA